MRAGHRVVALCGGATGLVGDPSGKSAERPMLDVRTLERNTECIGNQLKLLMQVSTRQHSITYSLPPLSFPLLTLLQETLVDQEDTKRSL